MTRDRHIVTCACTMAAASRPFTALTEMFSSVRSTMCTFQSTSCMATPCLVKCGSTPSSMCGFLSSKTSNSFDPVPLSCGRCIVPCTQASVGVLLHADLTLHGVQPCG